MLRTGNQYLDGLNDDRSVFLGSERVTNVSVHPAFAGVARTVADLFDFKRRTQEGMRTSTDAPDVSFYFEIPRSAESLRKRTELHRLLASASFGLLGRSPDYVASFVAGIAAEPQILGAFQDHILGYREDIARRDLFLAHAVVAPSDSRTPASDSRRVGGGSGCKVVRETDSGVVVSGIKILATSAAIADELWVGNVIPLAADRASEAITFAVPCATPGLALWARRPLTSGGSRGGPDLGASYDEGDTVAVFDNAFVPWERVFVHGDVSLSRQIYIETPAHSYANHQSCVRFAAKLRVLAGIAASLLQTLGRTDAAAARDVLGELAAAEAIIDSTLFAQVEQAEFWPGGAAGYHRRSVYGAMNWCREIYPRLLELLQGLCGSNPLQMPADSIAGLPAELRDTFDRNWSVAGASAERRMHLFALAWEFVGAEFGGRQRLYEEFFAGGSAVLRSHAFREAPWPEYSRCAERLLDRMSSRGAAPAHGNHAPEDLDAPRSPASTDASG